MMGSTLPASEVYDGAGNMVATLFKSGSSFTLGDQRAYDAWGVIRSGAASGEPNARYCANLGHLADDESGLTYMRARYYEPSSGRFVCEDKVGDGINWYAFCLNNPLNKVDAGGNSASDLLKWLIGDQLDQFIKFFEGYFSVDINDYAEAGVKLFKLYYTCRNLFSLAGAADALGTAAMTVSGSFATSSMILISGGAALLSIASKLVSVGARLAVLIAIANTIRDVWLDFSSEDT